MFAQRYYDQETQEIFSSITITLDYLRVSCLDLSSILHQKTDMAITKKPLKTVTKVVRQVVAARTPKVTRLSAGSPELLAYAWFVEDMQKWLSLERFRNLEAKGIDWQTLQYWLYFAECLVTFFNYESTEDKSIFSEIIENAWEAMGAASRSYNQSKYTFMYMTLEERDAVRDALLLCEDLKSVATEEQLINCNDRVVKILS